MSEVAFAGGRARRRAAAHVSAPSHVAIPVLLATGIAALILLPYLVGRLGTPAGFTFRGMLWPSDDEAVYLSAVRQGLQGSWLWRDQFLAHAPGPALMYLTYMVAGEAGRVLGFTAPDAFVAYQVVSALALFGALWALGSLYLSCRARVWFVACAFGASGLYWLDALLDATGHAPVSISALNSPQLSGLTMALYDGHRALGMAGFLAALTGILGATRTGRRADGALFLLYGACGLLLLTLTLSMVVPLAVFVLCAYAMSRLYQQRVRARWAPVWRECLYMAAIVLPSMPLVLYYLLLFRHGIWAMSGLQQIGAPPAWEPVLVIGVLLPLAWWGWRAARPETRPLANALALWCCCAVLGRNLPFWQSIRLTDGISVPSGALFALGLLHLSVRVRMRWLILTALGAVTQYLFLLSVLVQGHVGHLYVTASQGQALRWLQEHAGPRDVVLSSYAFGNLIPEVASCHVVVGHPQLTLDIRRSEPEVRTFFGGSSTDAARQRVLWETGATLVVYDPETAAEGPFDPRGMPGLRTAFVAGNVAILIVQRPS